MKNLIYFWVIALLLPLTNYAQSAHTLDSIPENWGRDTTSIEEVQQVANWWKIFNDPVLNALVEKTVQNNLNIKIAIQKIEQGRLLYKQSQSGYYPSFAFNISANTQNTQLQENDKSYAELYNAGISMNWEIDVFGRVRKGVKVAKYSYEQAQEDKNAVMVSLLSEVSSAYIRLRMYQNQIIVAESNITSQQQALDLARDRYQNGMTSALDVYQSESIIYNTKASINTLRAQVINEVNLIQVYIGEYPQNLKMALLQSAELPNIPERLQTLLPVDVVRQRPDIRSAEKAMMGMVAQEELAKAEMLPSLAITGNIGFSSVSADTWFNNESMSYYVGPTLSWDIFQGMYKQRSKQIAKVQFQEAQLNYQNTILTAMKEVENSLTNIKEYKEAFGWVEKTVDASNNAFTISMDQYRQGMIDYQPVLNSQQSLLSAQNEMVQTKGNLLGQIISLYQSLGGNWVE
ncbi:efflux transporter outer membrane subunit [Flammeovirga agarivorans]|uniref:TolC family protein n=1 Tax=Flammeovirga agarivorans TaxID=2726742 RepID=A0A7X8XV51_9BACT|nr:TolC family protein [Flammeovirga agarivorans]NLR90976.1 TolC family protein [Flammeovirga agarivorans]